MVNIRLVSGLGYEPSTSKIKIAVNYIQLYEGQPKSSRKCGGSTVMVGHTTTLT
jgi:hypothetical protein